MSIIAKENELPLPNAQKIDEGSVFEEEYDDDDARDGDTEGETNDEYPDPAFNNVQAGACPRIGIDLGTTTFLMAYMKRSNEERCHVEMIRTDPKTCSNRSMVAYCRNGEILVGNPAVRKLNSGEICLFGWTFWVLINQKF